MHVIDNILVDEAIPKAKFNCDLKKCKGACCTFPGENGAPLLDEEINEIYDCLEAASKYLSPKSLAALEKYGFFEDKRGNLTTVCLNKRDCVFVYYDGDVAKCALEKAYFNGETKFRKPISCHLFPIRVGNFGGYYLYYEKINECSDARKAGEKQNAILTESLKDAITRAFGEDFYESLKALSYKKVK